MTGTLTAFSGRTPDITGALTVDAKTLTDFAAWGEETLVALPGKPERSPGQQARADEVHRVSRWLRSRFMKVHAQNVYDTLTDGCTRDVRLDSLVSAAALEFPGLVPTRDQLDAESTRMQAGKEGREIDQAIFFRGILKTLTSGIHLMESMLRPTRRALELLPEFRRTGLLRLDSVDLDRDGTVANITIRNPHCLNAEDNRLTEDMETAVDLALLDDAVRVGTLRGCEMTHPRYAGRRVFSAGINLKELHAGRISYTGFLLGRELGFIHKIQRGLIVEDRAETWPHRTLEKPWAAAVDTFAIGGGMQLLFVFDKVVAGDDSYFTLPAAQEGIVPGVANLRLGRLAGPRLARQVILGGRRIGVRESAAELVCDEVVPAGEVGVALDRSAERLDNPAVVANRKMINLAEEPLDGFREYMAEFALAQGLRLYSQDVIVKVDRFSR
ncbi:(3,5-dihydroxyphenyl)acetyl-CoA 1,2-dioxygenase DpgC [Actinocorallia aurantiaca]|uniref:3,5-dihydroxyphenylacetyl-CoA monooxygenase n=1 Tax=Actinocorallia aurantiaca TaxID=46204 RepID=A0ABP6GUN4_9ACTN